MFLKDLCELHGVSGNEKPVRNFILEQIKEWVDSYKIDKIGNLVVTKDGTGDNSPKVLICAHMDEVGLMITEIVTDGYLKFQPVGGIDPAVLISKTVLINQTIQGVIGLKAVHLQKKEERKQKLTMEDLYIDIGAETKEEAERVIKLGDYAAFSTVFEPIGSDLFKAKALDDRVGCALLMETLQSAFECQLTAAFTVQEEVGLRGSKVLSNYIEADLAIIIEATLASDYSEINSENWIVALGKGPACSLMDSATIYRPELVQKVLDTARKNNIPLQFRQGTSAANDAGNLHQAGIGIPTITISIPCRNIHTMSSLISQKDYENTKKILKFILEDIRLFVPEKEQAGGTNG